MSSLDDPQFATGANYGAGPYSGQPNKARPSAGVIAEGFDPQAPLPAEWRNYLDNLFGKWLASLRDGTVSVNAVTADGTGGVIGSPTAGTITASGRATVASLTPTASAGTTPVAATLYKDLVPWAWAKVSWSGSAYSILGSAGFDLTYNGATGLNKLATGIVDFRLLNTPPGGDNGTAVFSVALGTANIVAGSTGSGNPKVFIYNTSAAATDAAFQVIVFAK